MTSFAGWYGRCDYPQNVLARMTGAMDGLNATHEGHTASRFAVRTSQPGLAGDIERIAVSDDGRTVLAFAGSLYTDDDTARTSPAWHCLRLYERQGLSFPVELSGTFAIGDLATGRLHLISDRLSSQSIYYTRHGDALLFGSEVKALLEAPGVSRDLNEARLVEFLSIQCLPGAVTYYDHIRQVPPASVFTWDGDAPAVRCYWKPESTWDSSASVSESAERIAEAFKTAVHNICAGRDRVGLMLSGGLDSRAIAAASPVPLHCMTLHGEDGYEVQTARQVATSSGYEHSFVLVPPTYPLELVDDGSRIADGFNAFHHAQSLYLSEEVRKQGLPLILNGLILNTLCTGSLFPVVQRDGLRKLLPASLPRESECDPASCLVEKISSTSTDRLGQLMGAERVEEVLRDAKRRLDAIRRERLAGVENPFDQIDLFIITNVSRHRQYVHMRALGRLTAEAIPGLDNAMIDAFLNTPPAHRFNHLAYRYALGRLDHELARIPYANTGIPANRGPLLEHYQRVFHVGLWRARRMLGKPGQAPRGNGGWPSFARAMSERPEWHALLRTRADSSRLIDMGLIRGDALRDTIERHISGADNSFALLGNWLTLEQWLEEYH